MNAQKYTQKTLEALTQAQNLAVEYGNPQLEQQHILWALCAQDGGVVPGILTSIGVDVRAFTYGILKTVEKLPKVSGSSRPEGNIYISSEVDKMFMVAEKTAENMKDEYVSVEHVFLAIVNSPNRDVSAVPGNR